MCRMRFFVFFFWAALFCLLLSTKSCNAAVFPCSNSYAATFSAARRFHKSCAQVQLFLSVVCCGPLVHFPCLMASRHSQCGMKEVRGSLLSLVGVTAVVCEIC